jgi:hypothetical protein
MAAARSGSGRKRFPSVISANKLASSIAFQLGVSPHNKVDATSGYTRFSSAGLARWIAIFGRGSFFIPQLSAIRIS